MVVKVFLRNDDVYKLEKIFLKYTSLIQQYQIPVLHAVIPSKLTKDMGSYIIEHDLQIAQHGFSHQNYGQTTKHEFGETRSYQEQKKDINEGFFILNQCISNQLTRIFVPPFHGFDDNTLKILQEGGFSISVPQDVDILNLKITLPLEEWKGQPRFKTFNEFSLEFLRQMKQGGIIGILTHHEHVNFLEFEKILQFLRALALSGKIEFLNIKENAIIH